MSSQRIFQNIEPLDRNRHRLLRLNTTSGFAHVRDTNSAVVLGPEFYDLAREYPIVFVEAEPGQFAPIAALGVEDGRNLFVDEAGRWNAQYIPASVRRYPFTAGRTGENEFSVCIDIDSPWWSRTEGTSLFDEHGEPTELTRNAIEFLNLLQQDRGVTEEFCRRLKQADLLQSMELSADMPDGSKLTVSGFWSVNEEKLRALPEAEAAQWLRNGGLGWIYAHLISLRNFNRFTAIVAQQRAPLGVAAPRQ